MPQVNTALVFWGYFTANGVPATGLTVLADVRNPAGTQVVTDSAAAEVGGGWYRYTSAVSINNADGDYPGTLKCTDDSLDYQSYPYLVTVDTQPDIPTAVEIAEAVLDEPLAWHPTTGSAGKALATASAYTIPTAAQNADAVWDEALLGHMGPGSAGEALAVAGAEAGAADPAECEVVGYIRRNGEWAENVVVTLQLQNAPIAIGGTIFGSQSRTAYTGPDGKFSCIQPRSTDDVTVQARVRIADAGVDVIITVPDASLYNVGTFLI